jgi:hypothetical protein
VPCRDVLREDAKNCRMAGWLRRQERAAIKATEDVLVADVSEALASGAGAQRVGPEPVASEAEEQHRRSSGIAAQPNAPQVTPGGVRRCTRCVSRSTITASAPHSAAALPTSDTSCASSCAPSEASSATDM